MSQSNWIRIATVRQHSAARRARRVIGGREIAIFNLGDRFSPMDNQCPHQSGPLCDGIVAGDAVVCPLHAWKVNLETGAVARPADRSECVRILRHARRCGVISIEA